jgi:hypothetical protein
MPDPIRSPPQFIPCGQLNPSGSHLIERSDLIVTFGDKRAAQEYYPKILTELANAKVNRISLRWDPNGTAVPAQSVGYWKEVAFGDGRVIGR